MVILEDAGPPNPKWSPDYFGASGPHDSRMIHLLEDVKVHSLKSFRRH